VNPARPRTWPRKVAFLLFLLLLLVALGISFWIRSVRERKWAELLSRVEELSSSLPPPKVERLPLGRTLVPGNAWDDYDQAMPWKPGQPPPIITGKINRVLFRRPEGNRSEVDALLAQYSASPDDLSQGARRREARLNLPEGLLRSDAFRAVRGGANSQDLTSLCIARARFLAEAGKTPESLDLLMDVCVFARDLSQTGLPSDFGWGMTGFQSAFNELNHQLRTVPLEVPHLLELDRRLQVLDELFPGPGREIEHDLLQLGLLFIREDLDDRPHHIINGKERSRRSWRSCFSSRLQAAAGFAFADGWVRRVQEARALPWDQERPILDAAYRELRAYPDEIVGYNFYGVYGPQRTRQVRAALRVLRVAAHYRATGQVLELDDPFGGRIRTSEGDGTLMIWHRLSQGSGDWTPKKGPAEYGTTNAIEVQRR
jgi:hypothetical protein